MTISNERLDSLLADNQNPEDLIIEGGLLKQLTQRLVERALQAEMTEHLGYAKHKSIASPAGNTRNGTSRKTLKGELGALRIEVSLDRHGSFEPRLIPKHQTRWAGFDDKILFLYARELRKRSVTVREAWNTSKSAHGPWHLSKTPTLSLALSARVFQQCGSAIPCRMTGIQTLNRRVRSRMHGGVGGGDRKAFPYPD